MSAREYILSINEGTPILLEDIPGNQEANRQTLKRMTDKGEVLRYQNGIYYRPRKSSSGLLLPLNISDVLTAKYMVKDGKRVGYLSGYVVANQTGITSQLPAEQEIVTNLATSARRKVKIRNFRVVLTMPTVVVTDENWKILQVLDLITNAGRYSEANAMTTGKKIKRYMQQTGVSPDALSDYISYYPDSIYRTIYEMRFLEWT